MTKSFLTAKLMQNWCNKLTVTAKLENLMQEIWKVMQKVSNCRRENSTAKLKNGTYFAYDSWQAFDVINAR